MDESKKSPMGKDVFARQRNQAVKGLISSNEAPASVPAPPEPIVLPRAEEAQPVRTHDSVLPQSRTSAVPKWKTLDRKDVRFLRGQMAFLEDLCRQINDRRSSDKSERLTVNSLIRAAVELLRELNITIDDVQSERDLIQRVRVAPRKY